MERRDYLKPSRFGDIEKRRILNTKNLKDKRSIRRTTNFNLQRNIQDIAEEIKENVTKNVPLKKDPVLDRKLALQKFKTEKELQKRKLNDKRKPPFIVGIPHHGSSPILKNEKAENNGRKETTATQEFSFQPLKLHQSAKKLTSPHTPTVLKRSVKKKPLKSLSSVVIKGNKSPKNSQLYDDGDEVLAAPLSKPEDVHETQRPEPVGETQIPNERIETQGNLSSPTPGTSNNIFNFIKSEVEGIEIQDGDSDPEPASQDIVKLNTKTRPRRNLKRSLIHEPDEALSVQQIKVEDNVKENHEEKSTGGTKKKNEIPKKLPPQLKDIDILKVEDNEEEEIKIQDENHELSDQVAFQHSRLQTETNRLRELADQWQSVVQLEKLPQEVVDEVDSLVGQTRLLTNDKFQQFHRLIVQFENKTGTHPVTLDDLNGFWDMVYLQVESLDKKYTSLDVLKNNNWVYPEPATKKKRRLAKKTTVNKVPEFEKSTVIDKAKKQSLLQLPEDQEIQTSTSDTKSVVSSVLLNKKRTRSNSPSPYIAMRLSGVGRTSGIVTHSPRTDGTPRSIFGAAPLRW